MWCMHQCDWVWIFKRAMWVWIFKSVCFDVFCVCLWDQAFLRDMLLACPHDSPVRVLMYAWVCVHALVLEFQTSIHLIQHLCLAIILDRHCGMSVLCQPSTPAVCEFSTLIHQTRFLPLFLNLISTFRWRCVDATASSMLTTCKTCELELLFSALADAYKCCSKSMEAKTKTRRHISRASDLVSLRLQSSSCWACGPDSPLWPGWPARVKALVYKVQCKVYAKNLQLKPANMVMLGQMPTNLPLCTIYQQFSKV